MATFQAPSASTPLSDWEKLFYDGYRMRAEVLLFGTAFAGNLQPFELVAGCAQIMRSHGVTTVEEPLSNFVAFQARQPEPQLVQRHGSRCCPLLICPIPCCFGSSIDVCRPLLLRNLLRAFACCNDLQCSSTKVGLAAQTFPAGVDSRGYRQLFQSAPNQLLRPGQVYSRPEAYLPQLQVMS